MMSLQDERDDETPAQQIGSGKRAEIPKNCGELSQNGGAGCRAQSSGPERL